jgi:uncharacterized protein (DUF433 family)
MATVQTEPVVYAYQTEEGSWRVTGSRVSLDSVVHMFHEGADPEAIVRNFPSLSLEQVYGAIAFYLHNREAVDQYLREQQVRWDELRTESEERNRDLRERIRRRAEQQAAGRTLQ